MRQKNRSNRRQASKIPKTGRIGQWVRVMKKEVTQFVLENAMQNVDQFVSTSNPSIKAAWIKAAIEQLENSALIRILMSIQIKYFAHTALHYVRQDHGELFRPVR